MPEVSDSLWQLVSGLLDLAVDCFAAGESNPMVHFIDQEGKSHMIDIKSASSNVNPQLVEKARSIISEGFGETVQCYAVAFDGYLTTDGRRVDAAFVEAGERGQAQGMVFAQRYRLKKRLGKVERVGRPVFVQVTNQLIG